MPAVVRDHTGPRARQPVRPAVAQAKGRAAVGRAPKGRAGASAGHGVIGTGRLGAGLSPKLALLAAGAVFVAALVLLLATGGRARALAAAVVGEVDRITAGAGLKLATVRLQGVSPIAQADVIRAAAMTKGQPLLALDLPAMRERVEQVGWVKAARVARLFPDTLVIAVTERPRLAVWQINGKTQLIDPDGHVIPEADAAQFADLPLVVGEGANETAAALLPLIQARPRLMDRLEALVRVDARRWDLRLKDGGIIELPAKGEDGALIQLDQLDQRSRLLELGFARIDLRDPELVTVRPRDAAAGGLTVGGLKVGGQNAPPAAALGL